MHQRRIIREALRDGLTGLATEAEDRVWATYEPPVNVERVLIDEGPVIFVYTRRDRSAEPKDFPAGGEGYVKRCCDVVIEILAAGRFTVDDQLDAMAEKVEDFVDTFTVPGLPATEIRHRETVIESSDQFEKPVGAAFLLYEAEYWRPWRVPAEDPDFLPCGDPWDIGVKVNGGPREPFPPCECDDAG